MIQSILLLATVILATRLSPAQEISAAVIEKTVEQLSAEDIKERDVAQKKLIEFGSIILPDLIVIRHENKLPEVQTRLNTVIKTLAETAIRERQNPASKRDPEKEQLQQDMINLKAELTKIKDVVFRQIQASVTERDKLNRELESEHQKSLELRHKIAELEKKAN